MVLIIQNTRNGDVRTFRRLHPQIGLHMIMMIVTGVFLHHMGLIIRIIVFRYLKRSGEKYTFKRNGYGRKITEMLIYTVERKIMLHLHYQVWL